MSKQKRCRECKYPRSFNSLRYGVCEQCFPEWRKRREDICMETKARKDAYKKLVAEADACEICGRHPTKRRLCLDHNHNTLAVRGILCFRCNYALGWFKDDPKRLRNAISYLSRKPKWYLDPKTGCAISAKEYDARVDAEVPEIPNF